jgi:hypothetical protein
VQHIMFMQCLTIHIPALATSSAPVVIFCVHFVFGSNYVVCLRDRRLANSGAAAMVV